MNQLTSFQIPGEGFDKEPDFYPPPPGGAFNLVSTNAIQFVTKRDRFYSAFKCIVEQQHCGFLKVWNADLEVSYNQDRIVLFSDVANSL